jgi:hypothetical protein
MDTHRAHVSARSDLPAVDKADCQESDRPLTGAPTRRLKPSRRRAPRCWVSVIYPTFVYAYPSSTRFSPTARPTRCRRATRFCSPPMGAYGCPWLRALRDTHTPSTAIAGCGMWRDWVTSQPQPALTSSRSSSCRRLLLTPRASRRRLLNRNLRSTEGGAIALSISRDA